MEIQDTERQQAARALLVESLEQKGIRHRSVLSAMRTIPRHFFVNDPNILVAYTDLAQGIECGQTISQPYIVAIMTQTLLDYLPSGNKILEIGTGSGYQAAILSQLVKEVYTVERIELLYHQANDRFDALSLKNIHTHYGDGLLGWEEYSPYDGILVTAACDEIPERLVSQLVEDGVMVIPVGDRYLQHLELVIKRKKGYDVRQMEAVVFVPMLSGIE